MIIRVFSKFNKMFVQVVKDMQKWEEIDLTSLYIKNIGN